MPPLSWTPPPEGPSTASRPEPTDLAHDQPLAFREAVIRRLDDRVSPDEAVHDLVRRLDDHVSDHDRCLDVRPDEDRPVADRSERPNVRVRSNRAVSPDDRGTPDRAAGLHDGAGSDLHASVDAGPAFYDSLDATFDVVEQEVIGLEDVLRPPRVFPPPAHEVGLEPRPALSKVVERLRDLELVSPGGFEPPDDREDVVAEQIDPDEGEVALRRAWFLREGEDVILAVELRDPKLLGVRDTAQHDFCV